jgi:hypothetical protein
MIKVAGTFHDMLNYMKDTPADMVLSDTLKYQLNSYPFLS